MLKKLAIGVLALAIAAAALLYWRAQAIFSSDLVRTSVASQLSRALGQPVTIGSIGATILPRVTMVLSDVNIGEPAAVTVSRLDVGTSARALLSRRIENATLAVDGARIQLPLPVFDFGGDDGPADANAPVAISSIDDISLTNVEIVSGGRTLRGDVHVVPDGAGLHVERMTLDLDGTPIDITGTITSLQGPAGSLTLRATSLDMQALQAFATDFATGITPTTGSAPPAGPGAPIDLQIAMTADRATFGTLALDGLTSQAHVTSDQLQLTSMEFGLFEGRYSGALTLALTEVPVFQLNGALADISMGALTAWAGQAGTMTGRLAGTLEATGSGTTPDAIIASTRGNASINVTQGTVQGLALVRTIVVASSMRAGASTSEDGSEAFTRLAASFQIANGLARTNDLTFESNDVSLEGAGQIGLDGTNIDLAGRVRLSEALTQDAGRDLVRYTQEGGRVTVPVTITGSAGRLSVRLEAADVLRRALTNKAVEEAGEAIKRGLGGLFGR